MTTTAITENPFGLDETMEASVTAKDSNAPTTVKKARVQKPKVEAVAAPNEVKTQEAAKTPLAVAVNTPAFPVTFTYGARVIQEGLSEAIAYFVDGMPTASGKPAHCTLTSVAAGDFVKYHQYLLSLSNLLEIAARSDREAMRLLMIVKCLIREGLNSESCLKAFAHLATGGTPYAEPHRQAFTSACYNARRDQGDNHANVEQGRSNFEPVYEAFFKTLPKYTPPTK